MGMSISMIPTLPAGLSGSKSLQLIDVLFDCLVLEAYPISRQHTAGGRAIAPRGTVCPRSRQRGFILLMSLWMVLFVSAAATFSFDQINRVQRLRQLALQAAVQRDLVSSALWYATFDCSATGILNAQDYVVAGYSADCTPASPMKKASCSCRNISVGHQANLARRSGAGAGTGVAKRAAMTQASGHSICVHSLLLQPASPTVRHFEVTAQLFDAAQNKLVTRRRILRC